MSAGSRYPVRSDSELSPEEKESYEFLKVVLSRHPPPHDHVSLSSRANILHADLSH